MSGIQTDGQGGGVVYAADNFDFASYSPPWDIPRDGACTPCWGTSDSRCCHHVASFELVHAHDDQPRRRWPWRKRNP